jgi:hypothetical protein
LTSSDIATICQDSTLLPLKVLQRALDVIPTTLMHMPATGCSQDETMGFQQEKVTSLPLDSSLLNGQETVISARADDAEVPHYLWDKNITPTLEPRVTCALGFLHEFALRWWKLHTLGDFFELVLYHLQTMLGGRQTQASEGI